MKLDPPLKRKGVEVTLLDKDLHTIHFVVHVNATVSELRTLEVHAHITHRVTEMVHYLEMEGFINAKENWLTHMGVILHPPSDGGSIYQTI